MTVRWKPLLILSGLFAVIAVAGLAAMAYVLVPHGSADVLPSARAERTARHYEKAQIHYKQALQFDGKNPAIHEEMAALYADWAAHAPPEKQAEVSAWRLASLAEAARYGKTAKGPRRELLAAAMAQDEVPESLHWAKDLLTLEPGNADAHYVVASEAMEDRAPVLPEVKRHLAALESAKAPEVRLAWLKARIAQVTGDPAAREAVLGRARTLTLPADASPVDRAAMVKLRALDVETTTDPSRLAGRVKALQADARALVEGPQVAPNRVMHLSLLLERVQKALTLTASKGDPAAKATVMGLVDAIDRDVDAIFRQSLAAAKKADIHIYLTYADHLRFRGKRERCVEVVDQALKSPQAAVAASAEVVMGLHAVAVEAALGDTEDPKRAEKAAPHIKELIASTSPRFQGLGHLFQGAIELEQSGVAATPAKGNEEEKGGTAGPQTPAARPKLRASALNHLKLAAAQLPDVVEAQARYGVALILSQDLNLGRQYLQNAMRQGNAEAQYQLWAAWSILQAGYPEEAEPVVKHLLNEMAEGRVTRDLEGTLHLLSGEIYQARRSPVDLKKALEEYDRSNAGKAAPAAVQLRMAQIDVQLGHPDRALNRLAGLRAGGEGGTAAEHLAVLIQLEQGKKSEALSALAAARARYPGSDELVGLEAALLAKDGKPKDADRVLADFLGRDPDNVNVVLMRAQVLAELLDDGKEARKILVNAAERSDTSGPLVQLALLDIRRKDYPAASATVARIRGRWKEAAAADLLDAQLALEQEDLSGASAHFDAALKKDPGNKLVQFWKAQIDTRLGAGGEAARAFETLAKDGSSKLLDSGLTLTEAARSALANLALQTGDVDGAIRRFEALRSGGSLGGLARVDRWQLVSAYVAKNQWPAARQEIASLLNDPKDPPTPDERVRAANYYRMNHEEAAAVAQLDYVLGQDPGVPSAVVTRAYMLAEAKKTAEAKALLRKGVAAPRKEKPPAVFFLLLAAMENAGEPAAEAASRALAVVDEGLAVQPKAPELVQAKYRLLSGTNGAKAAIAYVEAEAKDDPSGTIRRILADVYRNRQDFPAAETTYRDLVAAFPKDPGLAAALVRVTALRSARASDLNDRKGEQALQEKTAALIKEFRGKFPGNLAFLQEDCELAFRRGDLLHASAVTKEIDQVSKTSPVGPLLRARLYAAQGRTREVADAYSEALLRNPSQPDVRLLLGQTSLKLGETDEAVRQARLVLEAEPGRADALLLEARALAAPAGSPAQTDARRAQAVEALSALIKAQPKLTAAYHQLAEVQLAANRRDAAADTLRAGLAAVPEDGIGLAQLVEILASPARPGESPDPTRLRAATELAREVQARDKKGTLTLALAVGFHKADRLDVALDCAEKAEAKFDSPVAHLNHGDILLSLAERETGDKARKTFREAVGQYDLVLKSQANSVEAVNNKAWILHSYLGESKQALELAQGLVSRVDPSTLPGEFFDTLGAIQEAVGKPRDAEETYARGLRKAPDHPVLNYHMGRLLRADKGKATKARGYLEKALAGRSRLSPAMASELNSLMSKMSGN